MFDALLMSNIDDYFFDVVMKNDETDRSVSLEKSSLIVSAYHPPTHATPHHIYHLAIYP